MRRKAIHDEALARTAVNVGAEGSVGRRFANVGEVLGL
jgi:hypothetical protein